MSSKSKLSLRGLLYIYDFTIDKDIVHSISIDKHDILITNLGIITTDISSAGYVARPEPLFIDWQIFKLLSEKEAVKVSSMSRDKVIVERIAKRIRELQND